MISEKDKKIVAAVFSSRGKPRGVFDESVYSSVGIELSNGKVHFIYKDTPSSLFEYICTIEEYNQCIKDMSRAEWFGFNRFKAYRHHKDECQSRGIDTSNKELFKENCDYSFYDKPLVYTQGMYDNKTLPLKGMLCLDGAGNEVLFLAEHKGEAWLENVKNNIDWHTHCDPIKHLRPIKTPEQIKQDKLDAQVEEISEKHYKLFNDIGTSTRMFIEALQRDGYIVEPK